MKTVVAISSFQSDAATFRLVSTLYAGDYQFSSVVVVCSLGGHELVRQLQAAGYADCHVLPFDANLGSAGNLYERFKAAEALGGDYMLALNHDAQINPHMFNALVSAARDGSQQMGAYYPLRYTPGKQQHDLSGIGRFPFRFRGAAEVPLDALVDVVWSSSNGALYALAPFRHGLCPDASLWMGWEDYLYGLQLHQAGFRQCIVSTASVTDDYEYKTVRHLGRTMTVSEKPVWYCYYGPRNLAIISLHRCFTIRMLLDFIRWAVAFPAQILLSRTGSERWIGLKYYFIGLLHGCLNRTGKWRLP